MKVLLVGGGSGGHLTPLLAVADALKTIDSSIVIVYVGQKGETLHEVLDREVIDNSAFISAGKFRRYHGHSFITHLLDIKTLALNVRDFFRFMRGTWQAWRLLGVEKPDVVFLKGGFVSVPVGFAAGFRKIPYITHDSDAIPGLANRLTAKKALLNATAMPIQHYPYPQNKAVHVGIPIQKEYALVTKEIQDDAKKSLGYKPSDTIILSVGGGLGAQRINHALVTAAQEILASNPDSYVIHVTGKKLLDETKQLYDVTLSKEIHPRVKLLGFSSELFTLSAAADIVITRAGATNMAEFATQAKACVVIPAPHLTGGQQLHNARILTEQKAAIVLSENDLHRLATTINELLAHPEQQKELAKNLHATAQTDAALHIARLLLSAAEKVKTE